MDNELQNERVGEVWVVAYGPTVRSVWETREDAEKEEAMCRAAFPLQHRWAMYAMPVLRKVPATEEATV